jgi:hypothetical protein
MSCRNLSILLAVAAVSAVNGPLQAQSSRHGFFPHIRPTMTPPTTTNTTPMNGHTTLTQTQRQQLWLLHMMRMHTPSMFPMMTPMTMYGPYSSMGYGMGYGSGYGTPSSPPANNPAPMLANAIAPAAPVPMLAGITDGQGRIAWPLGLQILRPALETKDLRQRMEDLLRGAAQYSSQGTRMPAKSLDDAGTTMKQLQQQLRDQREDMAEATYRDAAAFLRRMDDALQAMR